MNFVKDIKAEEGKGRSHRALNIYYTDHLESRVKWSHSFRGTC